MAVSKARGGPRRRGGKGPSAGAASRLPLVKALIEIHQRLDSVGAPHALVGGLAVSARATPRTTRDVDLALSVRDDPDAERIIFALQGRGYRLEALIEQTRTKRLATARLRSPGDPDLAVVVDLLFASSGVEPEIVERAEELELLPRVNLRVATVADLLALKVLARNDRTRPQDADDLRALLAVATAQDRAQVAATLATIQQRGFGRGRRLLPLWQKALRSLGD